MSKTDFPIRHYRGPNRGLLECEHSNAPSLGLRRRIVMPNVPLSGAGVRSTEASAPRAG